MVFETVNVVSENGFGIGVLFLWDRWWFSQKEMVWCCSTDEEILTSGKKKRLTMNTHKCSWFFLGFDSGN